MTPRTAFPMAVCLFSVLLFGCAFVVDSVADFPVSEVVSDVASTTSEYRKEKQEQRVDELSEDYEEFVRSQPGGSVQSEASTQSILVIQSDSQAQEHDLDKTKTEKQLKERTVA